MAKSVSAKSNRSGQSRLRHFRAVAVLGLALVFVPPIIDNVAVVGVQAETYEGFPRSRSLFGNYLAGRLARSKKDHHTAAGFYNQALIKDPENHAILRQAFVLEASAGHWKRADELARKIIKIDGEHRLAHLFLGLASIREGKTGETLRNLEKASKGPIGQLTGTLLQAWVRQIQGDVSASFKLLDRLKKVEWTKFYRKYHYALIADVAGKVKIAGKEFAEIFRKEPGTLRVALAYARHLAHQGKFEKARSVIDQHFKAVSARHPMALALRSELVKKNKPALLVTNERDGLAEVFYGLGEALSNDNSLDIGLIYLQFALYLQPEFPLAQAALANVYEVTNQNARAIEAYGRIDLKSPVAMNVLVRKAYNLNLLKRVDEAQELLENVSRKYTNEIRPLDALGNIMRSHKRYAEAVKYYNRAIALIKKPEARHWSHFYSRGVSFERLKNWPRAEADLKLALKLNGNEPKILNYLGYSWVDQKLHLKQAMTMIRKAVKLKPDDGYYVDSLGWAYYRLGNFKAAVKYLEKAVELRSDDPVINDHLGDALWRENRRLEARFQWQQSLALKPEPDDIVKIKRKLLVGLPKIKRARVTKKRQAVRRKSKVEKKNDFQPFSQF